MSRGWLQTTVLALGLPACGGETGPSAFVIEQQIVFVAVDKTGGAALMAMRPDGSEPARIVRGLVYPHHPSVSPDGRQIVFEDQFRLFVATAGDSVVRELPVPNGYNDHPAWSPDGQHILFQASYTPTPTLGIYRMRPDGTDVVPLTSQDSASFDPAWSPDGQQIAFARMVGDYAQLYTMSAAGLDVRRVPGQPATYNTSPAWSSDGQELVFRVDAPTGWQLARLAVDGSGWAPLSPLGDFSRGTWSADGQRVVFSGDRGEVAWRGDDILVINRDGTGLATLYANPATVDFDPVWVP